MGHGEDDLRTFLLPSSGVIRVSRPHIAQLNPACAGLLRRISLVSHIWPTTERGCRRIGVRQSRYATFIQYA